MSGRAFVDTNVLLYLTSPLKERTDRAETLLREGGFISVQVLNEFTHVARRKFYASWDELAVQLRVLRDAFEVVPLTLDNHTKGIQLAQRYGYGIYDSLLLAAALEADCDTFWSEDLQDGQVIEGRLTIRNPFVT